MKLKRNGGTVMKKSIFVIGLLFALTLSGCGGNAETDVADMLTEVKTTQYFTDDEVLSEDIEKILMAGVNAPSAMNTQPWHFTAVTDKEVTEKIAGAMGSMKPPADFKPADGEGDFKPENAPPMPEGDKGGFLQSATKAGIGDAPLTIVISCEAGAELSAGLAVQNMAVEAQILGYGTKIMTAPTMGLNGENKEEYKELLGIPENQNFAAVLIVGKADNTVDTSATATTRNAFDEVVTVIGE